VTVARFWIFYLAYCVDNPGHNHPYIIQALKDEMDSRGPGTLQSHMPEIAGDLARRFHLTARYCRRSQNLGGNNCDRCRFVIRSSSISAMSKREVFIPQSVLQQISRRFTSGRLAFRWEPASPCELRPTTSNKNSRLCCSTASRTKCGLAHRKRTLESYFQNEGMGKR
jgi:hypothetical protein